ncbi:restriction endonuclease [Arthrobacter sp. LS16]|uniref:restriction endonuclease n=1 Tax=Arthrobacter sp. 'calajunan' TaxID=1690248 RepID=UPI003C731365
MKPLPTEAYDALTDALAKIVWRKDAFRRYVEISFRDHSELVAGLPFDSASKFEVAVQLVDRLVKKELKYRDFALSLMIEISKIETFPNIVQFASDRPDALPFAKNSVARLAKIIEPLVKDESAAQAFAEERARQESLAILRRQQEAKLQELKTDFLALSQADDKQRRGLQFERLLDGLFQFYDLSPRLAYNVAADQIDGAISYEGDDFIVEAKWTQKPVEREAADVFGSKVSRVGKNGLGLFVSANGFTTGFIETYGRSTPFITMDGTDLFTVLDGRVRLDDLLRAKKRHANETGSCYFPVNMASS